MSKSISRRAISPTLSKSNDSVFLSPGQSMENIFDDDLSRRSSIRIYRGSTRMSTGCNAESIYRFSTGGAGCKSENLVHKVPVVLPQENSTLEKQQWSDVDPVAWVLLISIAIECFIEGIGLGLTVQDQSSTAVSLFAAIILKE